MKKVIFLWDMEIGCLKRRKGLKYKKAFYIIFLKKMPWIVVLLNMEAYYFCTKNRKSLLFSLLPTTITI